MSVLHLVIVAPLLLAFLVPFLHKRFQSFHTGWFVLLLPAALFIYFFQLIPAMKNQGTIQETANWIPSLGINFTAYVDGLGLLFALLITGIGSLVVLYSIFYLSKEKENLGTFYVYLLMFMGAMLGVVLSDNLIVLYAFWELTSFSSFLLIGFWFERERSRYGAQKSMLITVFGGLAMLGGFLLLHVMTGSFSVREIISMASEISSEPLFIAALVLVLLGAFTKSAQFPFHIWLPDAMEAPTPVSAYLHSATMVKAGIYMVARMSPIFAEQGTWFWLVSGIGILTLLWGSFNAVKQTDLKAILAFSTVSQLGLIMSLLGVGSAALHFKELDNNIYMAAVVAAVFHLINHATFKGSLFMVAGIVDHETGTRDIRRLGGLMQVMPITFTIALIGSFSMAGLPPFNGFLSKEMFLESMVYLLSLNIFQMNTWGVLFPVLAWIASVFTFIYSMILIFKTFAGKYKPKKLPQKPHEAPIGMLISPIILATLVIGFGLFPNVLSNSIIEPAAASIMPGLIDAGQAFDVHFSLWHGFSPALFMTIGVVLIGILLYITLPKWKKIYEILPKQFTLNHMYNSGLIRTETGSNKATNLYMTGSIRTYMIYIFVGLIGILGFSIFTKDAFAIDTSNVASIGLYEIVLALIIVVASLTILMAKSRLTSIVALGAIGYTVALFFVLFRAPDLVLTQLVIETVSVALFLLCFYHLPKMSRKEERIKFKLTNAVVAAGVGIVVTLIALSAYSTKIFDSIAQYYIENTAEKAGGGNMVNVILVDFRGFDTMFEIAVLGIAALGIYGMVRLRLSGRKTE
ncbi:Na+/H+ antiporter subunit A [Lederbergia panacisoli]|uniref:Na+/H+ antiporter subunit A n=1 Tax=Lederbergia panacisoli TaxID=1255251 RepID=UPI00214C6B83|nr:Na+/H+ antiporter subunit A [Lederbergia panacisoli]MCR2823591.1 Na+/H+ antiporter subunit A [Lederbergia panacisoli]